MVLKSCPFCHRPFEAQQLSKELIESDVLAKARDFPAGGQLIGSEVLAKARDFRAGGQLEQGGLYHSMITGPTDDERDAFALNPEAFLTYRVIYRCKHCGKEWTHISVEEKGIPREYFEDEEDDEKTEYDAHVEEEREQRE